MKKWLIIAACLGAAGVAAGIYLHTSSDVPSVFSDTSQIGGFSGIVKNGLTETPLAHAHVVAKDQSTDQVIASAECDENGMFSLELPDGDYFIVPSAEGFVLQSKADTGREIAVQDGTRYVNARLTLWPAASLRGRVVSENVGIAAEIELHYAVDDSDDAGDDAIKISSQPDGQFLMEGIFGGVATVVVSADGFTTARLSDIRIQPGETTELGDIPMRDGITLFGLVTDASSMQGIAGADVIVRNARNQVIERSVTDQRGNYSLKPIEAARVMIEVTANGYYAYRQRMAVNGNARQEVTFSLDRAWGLVLEVLNRTGRQPANTFIKVTDISTKKVVYEHSVDNGRISLDQLKDGPYSIEATSGDRMVTQTIQAKAGQNVRIVLKPLAKITGHARNSDGSPLEKGEYRYIAKTSEEPGDSETPWISLASSDFSIEDLPEGVYRVELRSDNQRIVSSPEFSLRNGDIRDLVIQMTEGGVLQGRVVSSESGVGVVASVELVADAGRTVKTDNDGNFTIDKLPQTAFSIVVKPDREENSKTFENIQVKDNDTVSQTFTVDAPNAERRARRRAMRDQWQNGNAPRPPWGEGRPPWGDGPPPWQNGDAPRPPWGGQNGDAPRPPWGDGTPPWQNGEMPQPPWGNGRPPWGDGPPPWQNGDMPMPPRGNGPSPRRNGNMPPRGNSSQEREQ